MKKLNVEKKPDNSISKEELMELAKKSVGMIVQVYNKKVSVYVNYITGSCFAEIGTAVGQSINTNTNSNKFYGKTALERAIETASRKDGVDLYYFETLSEFCDMALNEGWK